MDSAESDCNPAEMKVRVEAVGTGRRGSVCPRLLGGYMKELGAQPEHVIATASAKENLLSLGLQPWELLKHFHHAVREGDLGFVRAALRAKPSLADSLDERLMCALNYAIKFQRTDVLRHLLASGASPNQRGQEGVRPVHVAATCNATEALQLLIAQKHIRLDATDDKGQTALHVACRRGHTGIARILLSGGADVRRQEKDGTSVLHQPGRNGSLELCELLLTSGASVAATDNNGITPVAVACIEGRLNILQALMKHISGAHRRAEFLHALNQPDSDGASPLHHAVQNHRVEVSRILLESGVNIGAQRNDGNSSLHIAASLGHRDLVALLLQHGADPAALDKRRRTPLHECGLSNQSEIAQLLIDQAADVNAADDQFMTPLHWAARRGHLAVADVLLAAAARLDCRDVCMRTPLHWAVIEDRDAMVERLLREPGIEAVFDKQDMHEKSPLHYAAERGCLELTQKLLERGANRGLVDADERRPEHVAAQRGHLDCLQLLISASVGQNGVDQRDADESTSMLLAAEAGRFHVLQFLCDCGADACAKDDMGRNALMLAVSKSHLCIAKFLLDRDFDVNALDVNKNTALHYAAKEPTAGDCVKLLLEHSALLSENNSKETAVDFAIRSGNSAALDVFLGSTYCSWTMAFRRHDGRSHLDLLIESAPEFVPVIYNYALIDPGPDDRGSQPERYSALLTMAKHKRLELLHHPLSSALMQEKWKNFARYALWLDLVSYALFLTLLTVFIMDTGPTPPTVMEDTTGCRNATTDFRDPATIYRLMAEKSLLMAFVGLRLIFEVLKAARKRLAYLRNTEVYFFLVLYFTTLAFVWPPGSEPCMWNWMCGVTSVILAWSYILFQIEYIPVTGIYSLMFQRVLLSLVKVLLVFAFFIVGFAIAFHITMLEATPFSTLPLSILKTFDMTIGELEFVTYFVTADFGLMQTGAQCTFALFVIIMPIALINLLIGIAVGDIEGIMRDAEMQLLQIRVRLIYELETNLPAFMQRRLYRQHRQVHPNRERGALSAAYHGTFEADYRKYCIAKKGLQRGGATDEAAGGSKSDKKTVPDCEMSEIRQRLARLEAKLDEVLGSHL